MKSLLILGAGKEQVPAILAAKAKNIRTIAIDRNTKADGAALSDEFHPVSTRDLTAVLDFVKAYKGKIDGVMTIASDIPHIVSAVASERGLPGIPVPVAEACVHKFRMKEILQSAGVNIPAYAITRSVDELKSFIARVGYPVVIKPVDNSGARGVLRLTEDVDVVQAFDYAKGFAFSGEVMVEKFIGGLQISTEGLMLNGTFYCTGFADRNYTRLEETVPYMIEDGGDIPTILGPGDKTLVTAEFEKAVRALGIAWGPGKGDMVLGDDGKAYVIEIAARLSGGNFCYDKVPWATGVDIVDILIDMAVGNPVDVARFTPTKSLATSQRYFFPPQGEIAVIEGAEEAGRMPHIRKVDIWAKPGDTVTALENHPSRVGYVISLGPTRAEAVDAASAAVKAVTFTVKN